MTGFGYLGFPLVLITKLMNNRVAPFYWNYEGNKYSVYHINK